MGKVINKATAPLGVKLFKGGPYPDAGMGDAALRDYQNVINAYSGLMMPGQMMIGQGIGDFGLANDIFARHILSNQQPTAADLGFMGSHYLPLWQHYVRQYAGVDPEQPSSQIAESNDPILSFQTDRINQARQAALNRVRARLAERGISAPQLLSAAEQRIHSHYDQMLQEERAQMFSRREGALRNAMAGAQDVSEFEQAVRARRLGELGTLIDAARGRIGMGMNLLDASQQPYRDIANLRMKIGAASADNYARNMGLWGNLLGYAAGGGFGWWRNPRRGGGQTGGVPAPTQGLPPGPTDPFWNLNRFLPSR